LNVFTRCGLSPRADQIRCTVAGLTPWARAIDRQLQCVSSAGLSCKVARTISATFSSLIDGLRPRPARTPPNPFSPSSPKRSRHALTVVGETLTCAAICVFATPSLASSNARARATSRCAATPDLVSARSTSS